MTECKLRDVLARWWYQDDVEKRTLDQLVKILVKKFKIKDKKDTNLINDKIRPHSSCPLCRLYENREITTRFYFENDQVILVDCKTCGVPMVVLKRHTDNPSREEIKEMYWALLNKVPENQQKAGWQIENLMRSIPNHPHYHLRKVG